MGAGWLAGRGLHVRLFSMVESLDYTLEHESNVASIKADDLRPSNEVKDNLEKILGETLQIEEQVNDLMKSIEKLDYSTTIDV